MENKSERDNEAKELSKSIHLTFHLNKYNERDYSYMQTEFENILWRLCQFTPHRKDLHHTLQAQFDIGLYMQMYKNNCLDVQDFMTIIDFLFVYIHNLCCPFRDEQFTCVKNELISYCTQKDVSTTHKLVHIIQHITETFDMMKDDMNSYIQSERAASDFELLQSEKGQQWLRKRNSRSK